MEAGDRKGRPYEVGCWDNVGVAFHFPAGYLYFNRRQQTFLTS